MNELEEYKKELDENAVLLYDLITEFTKQNDVKLSDLFYVFALIQFEQFTMLKDKKGN
jgi:hypothetical protein